jgi:hypothetical protein
MPTPNPAPRKRKGLRALTIALATILATGVVGVVSKGFTEGWITGSTAASTPETGSLSLPCGGQKAQVTSPKSLAEVRSKTGVVVKGEACGLAEGETLWLFDYGTESETYYLNPNVVAKNGLWAITDRPIGHEGDDNKRYTLVVVLASRACGDQMRADIQANVEGASYTELLAGCTKLAERDILVTYP